VVAAAVMFRRPILLPDLNDSKKLSFSIRESLFREIAAHAHVGIGRVSESVIDEINILQATRLAMREAVLALPRTPGVILIDGTIQLDLPLPQKAIVGGDGRSAAIAAASVVAKVFRDYWMRGLDRLYPGYAFEAHKGYPTPEHLRILGTRGASPVHRRTFRPVRDSLDAVQR
jgi:ribonuclease HII